MVITRANKPTWFEKGAPFRAVDPQTGRSTFESVHRFRPGGIYAEGSIDGFHQHTPQAIDPQSVLYMFVCERLCKKPHRKYWSCRGDHIFSDLVTPARSASWHTVAIIQEIARETEILVHTRHSYAS